MPSTASSAHRLLGLRQRTRRDGPAGRHARHRAPGRVPGETWSRSYPLSMRVLVKSAVATVALSATVGAAGALVITAPSEAAGSVTSSLLAAVKPAGGSVPAAAAFVVPSVVTLDTVRGDSVSGGSGVVLRSDGLILTNDHVVSGVNSEAPTSTLATFSDGHSAPFAIVGADADADIAVVRVTGVPDLTPITVGSGSNLQVGQDVVAVGAPLGLSNSVTHGIVSALHRSIPASTSGVDPGLNDVIQTDAAANPGNSGGALVDLSGRLVGIMTASATVLSSDAAPSGSIGLNFAIPAEHAINIADQLLNPPHVTPR